MSSAKGKDQRRPFEWHGVEFKRDSDTQHIGVCPDCGKVKFHVNKQNGLWDCKVCGHSGNLGQFLEHVQRQYREALTERDKQAFARRIGLPVDALDEWDIGKFDNYFTFLACDASGRPVDIRCRPLKGKTLSTAGCSAGLLGAERLKVAPAEVLVIVTEGETDAIAVQWKFTKHGWRGVVVSLPGVSTFKTEWLQLFEKRIVHLVLDHDEPARKAEQRLYRLLQPIASKVTCVDWPDDLQTGFDVRDWLTSGRTWKALRKHFRSEPRLGIPATAATTAPNEAAVEELHGQYVYVVDTDEFIQVRTRRRFKPSMLDRVYANRFPLGKKSGSNTASQCFWNEDGPRVDLTTYRPVVPQSKDDFEALDPLTSESDPRTGERLSAVNIYCPSRIQFEAWEMDAGDDTTPPKEAVPWLNLGEQLFGSDLPLLLDYMAFTLQHPEQKANWHPWIISEEGAGKDTFIKPYIAAIGDHNVKNVQGKMLRSTFSEWAPETKLVIVRDIAKLAEDDWNTLKSFLTHPPDRVCVNLKRVREYWIPNLMHFLFMTNNDDAIELDEQARRLLVLKARTPKTNPADPEEPYHSDTTNAYVARESVHRAVTRYLLDRKIDAALMRGRAPETTAKQAVVEANESEVQHLLRVMRDAGQGPFGRELLTAEELRLQLRTKLHPEPTWKAIGQALKRARLATRLSKQARYPKATGAEHKKVWVWASRHSEFYERLTDVQLGEEYERQRRQPLGFRSTPESRKALVRKPKFRLVQRRRAQ